MSQENVRATDRMGTEKIGKLMLEFGVPAAIGLIVNALYSVVDSIFIGQGVGANGIAALTVAAPIMLVMMAVGVLIGGGGNALMAIRLGQQRHKEAEKILGNSFTLVVIAGVAMTVGGLTFLEPILRLAGATSDVMPFAKEFVGIILIGFLAQGIGFGLNNFIRTTGNPKRAMGTMIVGAVVNTILNYLFVIVLHWGLKGSAWATVIGQSVSAVFVLQYFLSAGSPIRLKLASMKPDWVIISTMLPLGFASFIMQAASSVVTVILNHALVTYGALDVVGSDGALAAMGVVTRIAQFFIIPVFAYVLAAQPIIGYNYGARQFDRVKKTFTMAAVWATGTLFVFYAIIMIFPGALVGLFGLKDPDLLGLAIYGLRAYLFMMPLIGFQMLGANYFQSTGQAGKAAALSLSRQVIFYIPALFILPKVVPILFGGTNALHGVLFAAPVADLLSTVITGFLVLRELSHLDTKHMHEQKHDPGTIESLPAEA